MSTVMMHNVVSVDGYIADENDDIGPLFEWYFNGDHSLTAQDMADPEPGGMNGLQGLLRLRAADLGRASGRW